MPVSPRDESVKPTHSDDKIVCAVRAILKEARGNYVVWGRLMQGVSGVDPLTREDLASLIKIVKRFLLGE